MAIQSPNEAKRVALCEWLTANDIDVDTVPIDSDFEIIEGPDGQRLLQYTEFVRSEGGGIKVDPEDGQSAWKRTTTAPCKTDPPTWLNVPVR
jgi:hypothetical protein